MRIFGLIGNPLAHSFSKNYFTQKFISLNLSDCIYENFELQSIDQLQKLIISRPLLKGLNVTIPFKQVVLSYLKDHSDVVKEIGACNCIKIHDDELYGYNTDVTGFENSLLECIQPQHTQALVLGTGGASKAVQFVLKKLRIDYLLVSRSGIKDTITYQKISKDILGSHKLIINTTPLGTFPKINEYPDLPYQFLTQDHFLYDLVYNPEITTFLSKGATNGAQGSNGYRMLVLQAEESWAIWNDY
jgi:shikimate dehydrogenase